MNRKVEKEFGEMVTNLLQTEFCSDWNPMLLHGFMGIASEAGELLSKYLEYSQGASFTRTDTLIELSDLLHYMQMILDTISSSVTEIMQIAVTKFSVGFEIPFYDDAVLRQCYRLDPDLLRGFAGLSSEAGELLNRYKKFMYYHGESFTRDEILDGLAKLFCYMRMVIGKHDSSVEEVMCINMAKLGSRYPDGYTHDKAITHQRDKKAERVAIDAVIAEFVEKRKETKGEKNG